MAGGGCSGDGGVEGKDGSGGDGSGNNTIEKVIGRPFYAKIIGAENGLITIDRSWSEFTDYYDLTPIEPTAPSNAFASWQITHKYQDTRDLLKYVKLGDDRESLVINTKEDKTLA